MGFNITGLGGAGPTINVTEIVGVMPALDVDPANGNIQTRTMAGNETWTFTNLAIGQSVLVQVVPGANTLTLTNVDEWTQGGTVPSTIEAKHGLLFTNIDGLIIGADQGGIS